MQRKAQKGHFWVGFQTCEINGRQTPEPPAVSAGRRCGRPGTLRGGGRCWLAPPGAAAVSCHSPGPSGRSSPAPSASELPEETGGHNTKCQKTCTEMHSCILFFPTAVYKNNFQQTIPETDPDSR